MQATLRTTKQSRCYREEPQNEFESPLNGEIMTDRISRNQTVWILLAIAAVGFGVAIFGYGYLISSNCGPSGASEFFSAFSAFHTKTGC